MTALVNPGLATELARSDEFNADACMNCGVCSAICPMGVDVEVRKLFRYVLLGMETEVRARDGDVSSPACSARCAKRTAPRACTSPRTCARSRHHIVPHHLRPRGGMTMPLPTGDVIGILGDNLRLRKSVLPLSTRVATKWTEGLDLPRGGETVLYTGMMYQLIPYIEGLVKAEIKFGDSWLGKYDRPGPRVNRMINISAFMARPSAAERAVYDQVPINVVHLLRKAGVQFGALYEDDLYSGALAYDLGLDEVVAEHAKKVHAAFKKRGVKTVITIDPHTTTMLRSVYPKILSGYDIEVKSYLEVLAEKGFGSNGHTAKALSGEVVVHDSCVFARYEGIVDEPRELLAAAGLDRPRPRELGPPDMVLRRPRRVALSGQGDRQRGEARRAAPRGRARRGHHVPDVLREPEQCGRRHYALQGHLAVPARGLRVLTKAARRHDRTALEVLEWTRPPRRRSSCSAATSTR